MSTAFAGIGLISIVFLSGVLITAAMAVEGSNRGNPTENSTDNTSNGGKTVEIDANAPQNGSADTGTAPKGARRLDPDSEGSGDGNPVGKPNPGTTK